MILITNGQRDEAVRYLTLLCARLSTTNSREANTLRLARKLIKSLQAKRPTDGPATGDIKRISPESLCLPNNHRKFARTNRITDEDASENRTTFSSGYGWSGRKPLQRYCLRG